MSDHVILPPTIQQKCVIQTTPKGITLISPEATDSEVFIFACRRYGVRSGLADSPLSVLAAHLLDCVTPPEAKAPEAKAPVTHAVGADLLARPDVGTFRPAGTPEVELKRLLGSKCPKVPKDTVLYARAAAKLLGLSDRGPRLAAAAIAGNLPKGSFTLKDKVLSFDEANIMVLWEHQQSMLQSGIEGAAEIAKELNCGRNYVYDCITRHHLKGIPADVLVRLDGKTARYRKCSMILPEASAQLVRAQLQGRELPPPKPKKAKA